MVLPKETVTENQSKVNIEAGKLYRVKAIQGVVRQIELAGKSFVSKHGGFHYVGPGEVFMVTRVEHVFGTNNRFVEILWKDSLWVCPKRVIEEA